MGFDMVYRGSTVAAQRSRKRGAVLILVLGAVAILSILAVQMTHRSHMDVISADRTERESDFRRAFDSGVAIAKGLIAEGRASRGYDFKGDAWHRTITAECGEGVKISVYVEDECGKFNLQSLAGDAGSSGQARKALSRIIEYLARQEPKAKDVLEAAGKSILEHFGKQGPGPGSTNDSEPLYTLDGMRAFGIPGTLIFGRPSSAGSAPDIALCKVLTVWGDWRINLNTAPKAVLYSLDSEFDEELVERIAVWRGENATDVNASYRPFKQTKDLELVEGIVQRVREGEQWKTLKNLHAKVADRLTVRSTVYSARLVAEVNGRTRQAWAIFQVGPGGADAEQQLKTMKLLAYEEIEP